MSQGWIYVLDNQMGHYKIGKSTTLNTRIKTLKIQLPFPVTIAYVFKDVNCHQAERALHKLFASKRKNGEWFELDPIDDIGLIMELASWTGWYEIGPDKFVRDPFFDPAYRTGRGEWPPPPTELELLEEASDVLVDVEADDYQRQREEEDERYYAEYYDQCHSCSQHYGNQDFITCAECEEKTCPNCVTDGKELCKDCDNKLHKHFCDWCEKWVPQIRYCYACDAPACYLCLYDRHRLCPACSPEERRFQYVA